MKFTCEGCSQEVNRRVGTKDAGRFCTKACFGEWKSRQNLVKWGGLRAKRVRDRERLLLVGPEVDALRRIARYVERPRLTRRPCRICSTVTIGVGEIRRSCASCTEVRLMQARRKARQSPAYKAGKLKYKSIRRAREAIEAEAVSPMTVFRKAGWKCQLCGIDTPRALRGTYEPNAPELDHKIPLAKGGGHTWANVQCACRSCNQKKGASVAA